MGNEIGAGKLQWRTKYIGGLLGSTGNLDLGRAPLVLLFEIFTIKECFIGEWLLPEFSIFLRS